MLDKVTTEQYDPEIFKEAIAIFIEDTSQVLTDLIDEPSIDIKRKGAHRIKGASLMIGALDCARSAKELEHCSDDKFDTYLKKLRVEHKTLIAYLKSNFSVEE